MNRNRAQKFLWNTLILTVFSLTSNLISTRFTIYLSNQMGAEGTGLLQLVLSVYYMSTNIAAGGIHYAVTRFVAEALAQDQRRQIAPLLRRCLKLCLLFGLAAGGILLFGAKWIGTYWLCDPRTILSLRCIAIGLPFFSIACSLRSFFLSLRNTWKPTGGQLSEQFSYILATAVFLHFLLPKGLPYACCSAALGMTTSEIIGCAVTYLLYRWEIRRKFPHADPSTLPSTKKILAFSLPISAGSTLRTALTSVENVLIPSGLKKNGLSYRDSLSAYGAIKGMVLPTLTFPSTFLGAFSMMLVPEIAEAHAKNDSATIRRLPRAVFRYVSLFSLFTVAIFACYSEDIADLFFQGQSLGHYFRLLSPLLPFLYLDGTVDAILKGMSQQVYGLKVNITDASLRILLIFFLLPRYGTCGYLMVVAFSAVFNSCLSMGRLLWLTKLRPNLWTWLLLPLLTAGFSCVAGSWRCQKLGISILWGKILPCLLIYLLLLFLFRQLPPIRRKPE